MGKIRMDKEIWKPVVGYKGLYEVSNMGKVRGIKRSGCTGECLKGNVSKGGYQIVMLYNQCEYKHCPVHRLVATAFIPNPEGKRTVNHIDGNKLNNRLDNLEWMTHGENHRHAYRIGLKVVTDKQREACSKTGKRTCDLNRKRLQKKVIRISSDGREVEYESIAAGARAVNGDSHGIIACCKGRSEWYKGYRWKYVNQQ